MSKYFKDIKDIFLESEKFEYIGLDKSVFAYDKLIEALSKPFKLILFYGKPGVGKTYLLRKIEQDLSKKQQIIFFSQPFFDEKSFLTSLLQGATGVTLEKKIEDFEAFLTLYKNLATEKTTTVLLDEAQLYPPTLVEKIRLLSDTKLFKFLFTVHKTQKEDILVKDYFQTRIWESIELPNSSLVETKNYLEKKFLIHQKFEYFEILTPKHINFIFHTTEGNLRTINKLMYKFFEICEYYEHYKPLAINLQQAHLKHLEMAAINAGLIHA